MSFWTVSQVKQDVFSPVVDSSPLLDYQEKLDSCFLVFLWFWICLNFTHWEGHQIIHRLMINSNRSLKKKKSRSVHCSVCLMFSLENQVFCLPVRKCLKVLSKLLRVHNPLHFLKKKQTSEFQEKRATLKWFITYNWMLIPENITVTKLWPNTQNRATDLFVFLLVIKT